ncbi:MAG TPA: ABC transporter ATP-binding protein [Blastocatellia bacterium]
MKPIIEVQHLSKRYRLDPTSKTSVRYATLRESLAGAMQKPFARWRGNGRRKGEIIWALDDVSFDVMPGEVMGIIGSNGAGKSTLLAILSRIIEPTGGRAALYGRVASLLEVGTGFHPDLSGRENVYLNGAVLGMRRREIEARFDEIVAFAEIEPFIDTAVKRYSSGMYVRLAFAIAAHLDPEILILDEVLAVGDASFQQKCLAKMDEVIRGGRTVLLVTHNLGMVSQHCERALLLDHGRVAAMGAGAAVVDHYLASLNATPGLA